MKNTVVLKRSLLARLYILYDEIVKNPYIDINHLKEILEVSDRTVDRYLEQLRYDFGAPIAYDKSRRGYYLKEKWDFPLPKLTTGEVFLIIVSTNLLKQFKGTPIEREIDSLEKKLELLIPDEVSMQQEEIRSALSVNLTPIKVRADVKETFEKVLNAIKERRSILIKYHTISTGETKDRKVDPYHIFNSSGVWYFSGYCHLRNEVRDFAMDRVQSIKDLEEHFEIPDWFSPDKYLGEAFRIYKGDIKKVRVHFDPYEARWIRERIWHESQEIKELKDGSVIMEVEGNPEELKRWILSFGAHAEVLTPLELRREIKEEVKKLSERYLKGTRIDAMGN